MQYTYRMTRAFWHVFKDPVGALSSQQMKNNTIDQPPGHLCWFFESMLKNWNGYKDGNFPL